MPGGDRESGDTDRVVLRTTESTTEWRSLSALFHFIHLEAAGGLVLMAATALAMVVANSPLERGFTAILDLPLTIKIGAVGIDKPLVLWINDGLMAVFFLLVGMELKREVIEGHLSSVARASLPACAALGGMIAPALIYAVVNRGDVVALRGWAIPSATDIAFALGVLSLVGDRAPSALRAFLLSVAIFDDLGAIVIIALFYTGKLSLIALGVGGVLVLALACLNRGGISKPAGYFLLGMPLWVAVLKSGVHATLAGVVVAMFIPLRAADGSPSSTQPPLHRLEHALHPWVAFGVLPLFAFANAGVPLGGLSVADLFHPMPLGILGGLLIGKPVGIMGASAVAIAVGVASLPDGVRWPHLFATALLCGIGFTMSLFIASLAFEGEGVAAIGLERLGIVTGSLLAGLAGYVVFRRTKIP